MRSLAPAFFSVFFLVGCVGMPIPVGHDDEDMSVHPDAAVCACHLPNATAACHHGACVIVSCDHGFADCDMLAANGCEATLDSDDHNCGACGVACPAHQTCHVGACTAPAPTCHDGLKNGHETDVDCGGPDCAPCGTGQVCAADADCAHGEVCHAGLCAPPACVCNPANAVGQCVNNACTFHCNAGFSDCNGVPHDGCEINTAADAANCGHCGAACSSNNLTPHCAGGVCNGTCNAGFADCDNDKLTNGCETNLLGDATNCGACGTICPAGQICHQGACAVGNPCVCNPPNGVGQCVNNACTIASCNTGYADCNHNAHDGCETHVSADPLNCGACGILCPNGAACTNGVCVGNHPCASNADCAAGQVCLNGVCH